MGTKDKKGLSNHQRCEKWKKLPWKAVNLITGGIQAEARWSLVEKLLHKFIQHVEPMWCCVEYSSVQIKSRPTLFGEGLRKLNKQRSSYMDFIWPFFPKSFLHVSSPIRYSKRKNISEVKYIWELLHTALYWWYKAILKKTLRFPEMKGAMSLGLSQHFPKVLFSKTFYCVI